MHRILVLSRLLAIAATLALCGTIGVSSQESGPVAITFEAFLADVRAEALTKGISTATLDSVFAGLTPEPVVVTRDRTQPEQTQSLDAYLAQRLSRTTIARARQMALKHETTLKAVETRYAVAPAVMVAIWGLESNFGQFTGTYSTVRALATLAYDNRRPLFRTELMAALTMLDRGLVIPSAMKGSWAGAMGQPQFMPSSFLSHAIDFNADGRIDIWTSTADVFGSMANYLKNAGWRAGERWGREVVVSRAVLDAIDRDVPMRTSGCRALRTMTEPQELPRWSALGVRLVGGGALPTSATTRASLVRGTGRHFLVYQNYEALLGYNCAHSYAVAAGLLADAVGR
jgi:membrane-bound lytic murein transglycosylase B